MDSKDKPLSTAERERLKHLAGSDERGIPTLQNHRKAPVDALPQRPDRQARNDADAFDSLRDRLIQQRVSETGQEYAVCANLVAFELERARFESSSSPAAPVVRPVATKTLPFKAKPQQTAWRQLLDSNKPTGGNAA